MSWRHDLWLPRAGGETPPGFCQIPCRLPFHGFLFFYFSSHNLDMAHLQINETLYLYVYIWYISILNLYDTYVHVEVQYIKLIKCFIDLWLNVNFGHFFAR